MALYAYTRYHCGAVLASDRRCAGRGKQRYETRGEKGREETEGGTGPVLPAACVAAAAAPRLSVMSRSAGHRPVTYPQRSTVKGQAHVTAKARHRGQQLATVGWENVAKALLVAKGAW